MQEILKRKKERENIFNVKYDKYQAVVKWITQIRDKDVRYKLINYYKDIASEGIAGHKDVETLFLASQGDQEALNELKRILEVEKISNIPELKNKYFY